MCKSLMDELKEFGEGQKTVVIDGKEKLDPQKIKEETEARKARLLEIVKSHTGKG